MISHGEDGNAAAIAGADNGSAFDLAAYGVLTRAQQIAATMTRAFDNAAFRDSVQRGDEARDIGDWAAAESGYRAALALFPLHWGYLVQYAHMIKEQGRFDRAEAYYRSAVALGAPAEMVDEHLAFVAARCGLSFVREANPDLEVAPLQAPPTMHDVRVLAQLCGLADPPGEAQAAQMIRTLPTNAAVLAALIADPGFARPNMTFLDVMRG